VADAVIEAGHDSRLHHRMPVWTRKEGRHHISEQHECQPFENPRNDPVGRPEEQGEHQ
jgi:hypothetical protein